jgi:hypothetical protein
MTPQDAAKYHAFNVYVQQFERQILEVMWECFGSPRNCMLCFDGIIVPQDCFRKLEEVELVIFERTGIKVNLKIEKW